MVKQILMVLILVAALTGVVSAVELADTPVHEAMRVAIAGVDVPTSNVWADKSGDEFGDDQKIGKPADKMATEGKGGKSVLKAGLLSALVPGGGQYYLGRRRTAKFFFAAEAATWVAYVSFHTYGNWKKADYIGYAAEHAHAQLAGKSENFLNWVGFYDNLREFNTMGRVSDPDRPYLENTPTNHWEWQSESERRMYRDLRNGSKESYRRADFMIVAAVVDRIISIVDAVRSASRMSREIEGDEFSMQSNRRFKFAVDPLASRQVCLTVYPGF